jgi:hypothetical protein
MFLLRILNFVPTLKNRLWGCFNGQAVFCAHAFSRLVMGPLKVKSPSRKGGGEASLKPHQPLQKQVAFLSI